MSVKSFVKAISSSNSEPISADNPIPFTLSTSAVDSDNDIVKQNWNLSLFKNNPIALFGHKSRDLPIGTWNNVRVAGGELKGELLLAKQGTSEFIDTVRSLVEQKILKSISVGFQSKNPSPRDPDKPWDGYILDDNLLLEASLVNIGANPDALMAATKSMHVSIETKNLISASFQKKIDPCGVSKKTIAHNANRIKIHSLGLK